MSKTKLDELSESVNSFSELEKGIQDEVIGIFKPIQSMIHAVVANMKRTIKEVDKEKESITVVQQNNIDTLSRRMPILTGQLKEAIESIKARAKFVVAELKEHVKGLCAKLESDIEVIQQRELKSCGCAPDPKLFMASLETSGCASKNGQLKLKKCAKPTCGKSIQTKELQEWFEKVPKRIISKLITDDNVKNDLERMKTEDCCKICGSKITDGNTPTALPCACMVCSNCVKTYNAMIANKVVKTRDIAGINTKKFGCPSCKLEINKQTLFSLIGSVGPALRLFRIFTLLSMDTTSKEICCVNCLNNIEVSQNVKNIGCRHVYLCRYCQE